MIVPPWSPGLNTPTSGFRVDNLGFLKVDPKTALGWDFTTGSRLYDEDSKSGLNGWVGIAIGLGTIALSATLLPGLGVSIGNIGLSTIGEVLGGVATGWATVQEIKEGDFGSFHGYARAYNNIKDYMKNNGSMERLMKVDAANWLLCGFDCTFDGAKNVLKKYYALEMYGSAPLKSTIPEGDRENLRKIIKRVYQSHHPYHHH